MRGAIALVISVGIGVGLLAPALKTVPAPASTSAAAPMPVPPAAAIAAPAILPIAAPAPVTGAETVIPQADNGHYYATAEINGAPIRFMIDTGASTVALTIDDARRIGIAVDPAAFQIVGQGASGDVRGQPVMFDAVSLEGKRAEGVRGAVLEGLTVSLLGQSYLSRLAKVEIANGAMTLR